MFYNRKYILIELEEIMQRTQAQTIVHNPLRVMKTDSEKYGGASFFLLLLILAALEMFNFSTTEFALEDLLGQIGIGPTSWATILASAVCGMNLIGIYHLVKNSDYKSTTPEGWFLFAAWILAAVMNTALTWWGISLAIYNHPVNSVLVVDPMTIVTVIPIFVAIIVLLLRILLIGNLAGTIRKATCKDNPTQSSTNPAVTPQTQKMPTHHNSFVNPGASPSAPIFSPTSKTSH